LLFNACPGGKNTGSSSSSSENYTLEDVKKNWRAECERMEKINAENRAAECAAMERQQRIDSVRGMHWKLVVILSVPYCLCCKFTIMTTINHPSGGSSRANCPGGISSRGEKTRSRGKMSRA